MNLPNKLTMMRVVLVPVFMIFAAVSHYGTVDFHAAYMLIAGVIFAIASITDFLDGYLARMDEALGDDPGEGVPPCPIGSGRSPK